MGGKEGRVQGLSPMGVSERDVGSKVLVSTRQVLQNKENVSDIHRNKALRGIGHSGASLYKKSIS